MLQATAGRADRQHSPLHLLHRSVAQQTALQISTLSCIHGDRHGTHLGAVCAGAVQLRCAPSARVALHRGALRWVEWQCIASTTTLCKVSRRSVAAARFVGWLHEFVWASFSNASLQLGCWGVSTGVHGDVACTPCCCIAAGHCSRARRITAHCGAAALVAAAHCNGLHRQGQPAD